MNTGERPVADSFDALPSLMRETYRFCKTFAPGKEILDIGCGDGFVDFYLSDTAKFVTGIDIDKRTVIKAEKMFSGGNLAFLQMRGDNLRFADASFDLVISSQSIEHIKDDEKFLREVKRVLRKDGVFICATPNKLAIVPPGEKVYEAPYYPFHCREYTPSQFYGLLAKYFSVSRRICFYNPDRSRKLQNSERVKVIYRLSRFAIVRWLSRILPLNIKEWFIFFNGQDLRSEDIGTTQGDYRDDIAFIPEVIGAVCVKI